MSDDGDSLWILKIMVAMGNLVVPLYDQAVNASGLGMLRLNPLVGWLGIIWSGASHYRHSSSDENRIPKCESKAHAE